MDGHGASPHDPASPPRSLPSAWWLSAGAAVLLLVGVTAVALLVGGRGVTPGASDATTWRSLPGTAGPTPTAPDPRPGGAFGVPDPDEGAYEGSGEVALAWLEAMAQGEYETAFDLSCPTVQASAAASAEGGDSPAYQLGVQFFEQTLGGGGFTAAGFDRVVHEQASDTDVATFTLLLDRGDSVPLRLSVTPELTVCDFR